MKTECQFNAWKTIKLGAGPQTADDFRRAFWDARMPISDYANDILGKSSFRVVTEETEIELVLVTVAGLGFKDGAIRQDIFKRALELGLELCPNEVGPQLRLQYTDQPSGEWLLIGMEPIAASDGLLKVFYVVHDVGGLWFHTRCGDPGHFWNGLHRWVFACRKVS